jgi:hypothetical protein
VSKLPFDSKTTKRPFAVVSPANELNPPGLEVTCTANGSGVGLVVCACAYDNAPKTNISAAIAQREQKASFTKILRNKDADKC